MCSLLKGARSAASSRSTTSCSTSTTGCSTSEIRCSIAPPAAIATTPPPLLESGPLAANLSSLEPVRGRGARGRVGARGQEDAEAQLERKSKKKAIWRQYWKLAQRFPSGRQEFIYYTNDSYTPFPVPVFRSMTKKNGAFYGYFGVSPGSKGIPLYSINVNHGRTFFGIQQT